MPKDSITMSELKDEIIGDLSERVERLEKIVKYMSDTTLCTVTGDVHSNHSLKIGSELDKLRRTVNAIKEM